MRGRRQHTGDGAGNHGRGQLADRVQQVRTGLVALAEYRRRTGRAVKQIPELVLEQRPLLLDHQDAVETAGEVTHQTVIERPGHADLHQSDAGASDGLVIEQAKLGQRLTDVQPGLARCHDPYFGLRARRQAD